MTVTEDSVRCDRDGCENALTVLDSGSDFHQVPTEAIRARAETAGWLVDSGGQDFCPQHSTQSR
jgi:hypothetical protein